MALKAIFYGTRGSLMSVSQERLIYGGHTSCLTFSLGDDLLILDAGFGIANLATDLMKTRNVVGAENDFHILLTHFHWDHIQGLQYFIPIYFKRNRIHLHSPFPDDVVREVMNLLLDGSYTPFNGLDSLGCTWIFHQMGPTHTIGPFTVTHHPTVHVGETYAYRLDTNEGSAAVILDHDASPGPQNDGLVAWARGCNWLAHDAMFTPSEHSRFPKQGHSSFITAYENSEKIGAGVTLLTHHSPLREDTELSEHERYLEGLYNTPARRMAFAREGISYVIKPNGGNGLVPNPPGSVESR